MSELKPISFVMPAYNCAETVREAVESIIEGNFEKGDELIVVNDGSTDNTPEALANLKRKYPFIQIIDNDHNRGCPATRNVGINAASRDLIFNLDSDDALVRGSRKKLQQYMSVEKADVAAFGESHFCKRALERVTHKWIYPPGVMSLADYLSGPIVPGGNYIYTKESWRRVGGYWESGAGLHEFWYFSLKQIANGSKFVVIPKTYYLHRYAVDSLFARESVRRDDVSLMATTMLLHFADLIDEIDLDYIKANSTTWLEFDAFSKHPIRVKSGEIGRKGINVLVPPPTFAVRAVRKVTHTVSEWLNDSWR